VAALEKGHFGKGHLQERNAAEMEEQEEHKEEDIEDSQRATQVKNNIHCLQ